MRDEDLPTTYDDDVEAHLLKEALATGAAAAAIFAGAGAASGATTPGVAVLPDPGAMPAPKAPPIRTEASASTKQKHPKHPKKHPVLAGGGATRPTRGLTSVTPAVAVLPDPGAMPAPKAPPIRTEASVSTKPQKHAKKHHKK